MSRGKIFCLPLKSFEKPFKRRIKIQPRFLAHLTPTASELLDLSFLSEDNFFVDAPPILRLMDVVHLFNGVVVEQFKKRSEKLLSDLILLWRLLKLPCKILVVSPVWASGHSNINIKFVTKRKFNYCLCPFFSYKIAFMQICQMFANPIKVCQFDQFWG